jgi:predicted nucleic acid-binding protein
VIVDTGPFVAAANRKEPDHDACRRLLTDAPGRLVVPALVVAEATFMIERAGGPSAEAQFLRSLRSPRFQIETPPTRISYEPPTSSSSTRIFHWVEQTQRSSPSPSV